jgi:hypothetical protein
MDETTFKRFMTLVSTLFESSSFRHLNNKSAFP